MRYLICIMLCWLISNPVIAFPGDGLDLPLLPPLLGDKPLLTIEPIDDDDDDGDDPRDAPLPTFYGEEIDAEGDSLFYVIDTSCSMSWDLGSYIKVDGSSGIGTRMDRAKAEVIRSISGLSDNFEFNIIGFSCGIKQWSLTMQTATTENKLAAAYWVSGLVTSGGTGTGPAVSQSLADRENLTVLLLSDGAPNCGVPSIIFGLTESAVLGDHRHMIREANLQRATINVFGIAAIGLHRSFCQGVARDSGGSYIDLP